MGTLYKIPDEKTIIRDLKVTIHNSQLIFPSSKEEEITTADDHQNKKKKTLFLSNIDQVLNFSVETVHFFPANPSFPPEVVTEKLKTALSKLLTVHYDFMAGRIRSNPESGRLEIDCNGAGAAFVTASSEFSLNDIGDLVYPNPAFAQLIIKKLDFLEPDDQPLCILQVTSFKCGGFAMGLSTNHATFDGISFKIFLQNLASQAFDDKPFAVIPCNDRRLLAARSPPTVTFPHPELLKLKVAIGEESAGPPLFDVQTTEHLVFKIFRLSSDDINFLKENAKKDYEESTKVKITGFNVVTAHIWRCKALSRSDNESDSDRVSTILYAVDIRQRLKPPLPASYAGNAVLTAYASASCSELERAPFSKLVKLVYEGAMRMTDEYARSAIDWGEIYRGFPHGEFLISSWWRLGFAQMEYPWGKPRYSCPVVYHRKDIILLFPDIEENDDQNENGVNVLVALPAKEMEKFQPLFHKFLARSS